ncbi:hypothetical protein [Achromobacter insuavis]|uniref:hypothetical protein n=1 Tax=Achromobacter insuavis TaxID=1287735 RepID=UPI001F13A70A|nr:hypothetical protein [Achromobacter insuavis]
MGFSRSVSVGIVVASLHFLNVNDANGGCDIKQDAVRADPQTEALLVLAECLDVVHGREGFQFGDFSKDASLIADGEFQQLPDGLLCPVDDVHNAEPVQYIA